MARLRERAAREGPRRRPRADDGSAARRSRVALRAAASAECDVVVATIFVNPRQFDDDADLARYPRTPEADRALALEAGVDCLVVALARGDVARLSRADADDGLGSARSARCSKVSAAPVTSTAWRASWRSSSPSPVRVARSSARRTSSSSPWCASSCATSALTWRSSDVPSCATPMDSRSRAATCQLSTEGRSEALGLSRAVAAGAGAVAPASDAARTDARRCSTTHDVEVAYAEVVDPDDARTHAGRRIWAEASPRRGVR